MVQEVYHVIALDLFGLVFRLRLPVAGARWRLDRRIRTSSCQPGPARAERSYRVPIVVRRVVTADESPRMCWKMSSTRLRNVSAAATDPAASRADSALSGMGIS